MLKTIFIVILSVLCIYNYYRGSVWRKRASEAMMIAGQTAPTEKSRAWCYRNAVIAGELSAVPFYLYSSISEVTGDKPFTPFKLKLGWFKSVPVVFCRHYVKKKHQEYCSSETIESSQVIWNFKGGKEDFSKEIDAAIKTLNNPSDVHIIFMPCSSEEKYNIRFRRLAQSLSNMGYKVIFDSHKYLGERPSRHMVYDRSSVRSDENTITALPVIGSNVIIIDDVLTTGNSFREYAKSLKYYGVNVVGGVFLGKTVQIPKSSQIIRKAYMSHLKDSFKSLF